MGTDSLLVTFVILAAAMGTTCAGFFALKFLTDNDRLLRILSAAIFPMFLIAAPAVVANWDPDPHGFALTLFGFLAAATFPLTVLTASFLVRYCGRKAAD